LIQPVVLAAGRGVRFGGDAPKQLARLGGESLVAHAVRAARAVGTPLVVVSDDRVADAVGETEVVRNEEPARGIASSLQVALRALAGRIEIDAVVVGLADTPLVGREAYERLAAASAPLAYATYDGKRGNPVRIGREHWDEALALEGDEGARVLFRHHDALAVPCDGTGDPTDVDTPADLADLEKRWRSTTASE
jgi:molybdenum cofactor cytidylyltransferase